MTNQTFSQFSRLPLELQEKIITQHECILKLAPRLYKDMSIDLQRNVHQLSCTQKEFRNFLNTEKPLKFSALISAKKSYLFNLVNTYGNNLYWEVIAVCNYVVKQYDVYHVTKTHNSVDNMHYSEYSCNTVLFNVDDVINLLFTRYKWREFDLLTTFKIHKKRTKCQLREDPLAQLNMQEYVLKNFMTSVMEFIDEVKVLPKTGLINVYIVLIHFAWNFNFGHLMRLEAIPVFDSDTNKDFEQLNQTILRLIPDLVKMIPILAA